MPDPIIWTGTRYRDTATGRYISAAQVRKTFEESLLRLTRFTDSLAQDLRAGRISLEGWREEMQRIIKQTQMAAAELTVGGRKQMTQQDYGRVGQRVRVQYQYLENWVNQIREGGSLETQGRARQYLMAARSAYLALESERMTNLGYLARNVLRAAEHCAECIAETDKGLVPAQFLVPIGQRQCRGNCKCFLVYEKAA